MGEIGGEIGKERILGGLLKTGQTTQYAGYKDDGYYKKGLSKRYTILTAGQYAGTTSITLNAKIDVHSNNCVYDQRTKLMWSRTVAGSVGPGSDGKLPWTTNGNGEGIFAFAAAANLAKLAGYDDWRIPNSSELGSIQSGPTGQGSPDTTAFPDYPAGLFIYSSTTPIDAITQALAIYPGAPITTYTEKITNRILILVRGD